MRAGRTWMLTALAIAALLIVCREGSCYADAAAKNPGVEPVREAAPASSLWIVVNMFTGASSKQAVLVRDTLARLGAGGKGIVLPYRAITVEKMEELRPAFLALSPNGIPWCRYRGRSGAALADFFKALPIIAERLNIPIVGICGGHQAIALAFGGKVGPIRGGEDDCFPYGHNPTERGRHWVKVMTDDPIFAGMNKKLNMVQNHYDEVKRLPPGFIRLAANKMCPYQIIRHPSRPVYGIQAHCEYYYGSRPDGGLILRNFLNIARTSNLVMRIPGTSVRLSAANKGPRKTPIPEKRPRSADRDGPARTGIGTGW
jgi:GMP synthase (glutamine-hydrolysing)